MKNGVGEQAYPNGDVYRGDFVDDDRHGYGIMTYTSTGDVFRGMARGVPLLRVYTALHKREYTIQLVYAALWCLWNLFLFLLNALGARTAVAKADVACAVKQPNKPLCVLFVRLCSGTATAG